MISSWCVHRFFPLLLLLHVLSLAYEQMHLAIVSSFSNLSPFLHIHSLIPITEPLFLLFSPLTPFGFLRSIISSFSYPSHFFVFVFFRIAYTHCFHDLFRYVYILLIAFPQSFQHVQFWIAILFKYRFNHISLWILLIMKNLLIQQVLLFEICFISS